MSPLAFLEERYEQELERVFRKSWLFVGHDSLIPNNSDYFTRYMAEHPVIPARATEGWSRSSRASDFQTGPLSQKSQ